MTNHTGTPMHEKEQYRSDYGAAKRTVRFGKMLMLVTAILGGATILVGVFVMLHAYYTATLGFGIVALGILLAAAGLPTGVIITSLGHLMRFHIDLRSRLVP